MSARYRWRYCTWLVKCEVQVEVMHSVEYEVQVEVMHLLECEVMCVAV